MPSYAFGHGVTGWGGEWSAMVVGPLVTILVIVAVVLLARWLATPPTSPRQDARTSLDVLKARFARGEIDRQEYEDRRRTIGQ